MNFWIVILAAVVIAIVLVVMVIWGSGTGSDEEGYTVSDDKDDAHFDPNSGKMT